ncbi:hypothetical protein E2C01_093735 [Portunus trituberculatus]|uniref:Uncharacterized protein n=1 Tax=Portunus trituberculatus TaxID=210409 RepID=A0A5B7JYY3_PORTR|nr:hypothetical protein [Portunus trituberculatus]
MQFLDKAQAEDPRKSVQSSQERPCARAGAVLNSGSDPSAERYGSPRYLRHRPQELTVRKTVFLLTMYSADNKAKVVWVLWWKQRRWASSTMRVVM